MLRNIESQSQMKKKYQNFNKNNDDIPLEVNNINAEELNKSVEYEYTNPFSNISDNSKVDKSNICNFDNKEILSKNTEIYKKSMIDAHEKLLHRKKQIDENISNITLKISEMEKL